MGELAGAQAASERAKRMGNLALWIGLGLLVLYTVLLAVLIANGGFRTTTTTTR